MRILFAPTGFCPSNRSLNSPQCCGLSIHSRILWRWPWLLGLGRCTVRLFERTDALGQAATPSNLCDCSFGHVHKARWRGAMVAVKIVNHRADGQQIRDLKVLRETLFSSSLLHPNIVVSDWCSKRIA